jgi:filamentous hemagglutinin family protein
MNKIHNVIWSKSKNAFIVVAEGTNNCAKSGVRGLKVMIALILLSPAIGMSATLPQGGVISVGEGTIVNTNNNKLTIKQSTDKLGVNWQSFNVGADGQVVFEQPNSKSVALNRVVSSDGSAIMGKIDANGQVFIINPNGVIIGKDAQVNVGGLVASTLNITDENFKKGDYSFTAEGGKNGEVLNQGTIQAAEGGYVALLGKSVKNQGIIKAKLGTAALAAGNAVTLDFAGDGLLNIQVKESAVDALVDNKGLIKADGGSVLMTARASNALLETVVNNDGIIEAQTLNNRSGKIFLDGGFDGGTVTVAGTLDASAPSTGDGGFIETSGSHVKAGDVKITTKAVSGKTGTWLLDPENINIFSGNGPQTDTSIGATTLANILESSNVTLTTLDSGSNSGDISLLAPLSWSANTTLTLDASRGVGLLSDININGANGGLSIKVGRENGVGKLSLLEDAKINLNGANSTFAYNGTNYTIIRNASDLQSLNLGALNGNYAVAKDIDASISSTWDSGLGYKQLGSAAGKFTGVFTGLGHTISNLTINRPTEDNVGLIGYGSGTTISSISVNGNVIGRNNVGLIAGRLDSNSALLSTSTSTFNVKSALKTSGSVKGATNVGGAIGSIEGSTVEHIINSASVSGASSVGGIAGKLTTVETLSLTNHGSVTGSANNTGGIAGTAENNSDMTKSTNDGVVSGAINTGGIFGEITDSQVSMAKTSGNVAGSGQSTGGFAGKNVNSSVSTAYATGSVTGTTQVGGFVGTDQSGTYNYTFSLSPVTATIGGAGYIGDANGSNVENSYATGNVTSASGSAGFMADAEGVTVKYSYSTGSAVKGFLSRNGAGAANTVTDSYWDMGTSGSAISDGGVGKTSAEMKSASTFSTWSLNNTGVYGSKWRVYEGLTTPFLTAFMGSSDVSANYTSRFYDGQYVAATSTVFFGSGSWDAFFPLNGKVYGAGVNGAPIKNVGVYELDYYYSDQFGFNYRQTGNITFEIMPLLVSISFSGADKIYDGTTTANLISTLSGNYAGDDVSFAADVTYDSKNYGWRSLDFANSRLIGADAGNYYFNNTYVAGYIDRATLNVNILTSSKAYDGNRNASSTFTDSHFAGDAISVSVASTFSDKSVGTSKQVLNNISVSGADRDNYVWSSSTYTAADITKAALNVTATGVSRAYDATTAATVTLADNRVSGEVLTVSGVAAFADKNAGTGKLINVTGMTLSGADAGNYFLTSSSCTATANITKKALSVTLAANQTKVYDGTTTGYLAFTDNRIGGDTLTVSGTQAYTNKNVGTGKTVNVTGITLSGADAGNYTPNATVSTATARITKAALTVSATGVNKTYDRTTTAGITLSDNRFGSDVLTVAASGKAFTDKNAGTAKTINVTGITVTGTDAGNYTWNTTAVTTADIAKAALNVTASGTNKVYDGTTTAAASLSDSRIGLDTITVTATGKNFVDKNVGTGKTINVTGIDVTGTDAGNYTWNTAVATTANITKATLAVTATGVNKTYDGTATASVNFGDNRMGSDLLVIGSNPLAFLSKTVGNGKAISVTGITVTGADSGNYTWNANTATTADITQKALTVSAVGVNKTYDGTTAAGVTFSDDHIGADNLTVSAAVKAFADKNVGTGKAINISGISVTGTDASNYTWNATASTSADIAKAALNVTASGVNRAYDGTTNSGATLVDNRFGSDVLSVSALSNTFANKNAGNGKAVTVNGINVTGADAGNYTWNTTAATTADITKAALSVTATGVNKTYDGSTAASATLSDNRIGGDSLVLSASGNAFSDKNAGVGKALNVTGISVTGADVGNYTWNTSTVTSADIAKAGLNITATGVNRVYDGSTVAGVNFADNRIASDVLLINATTKAFSDKNVGNGKAINVSGITVSGADAGNYTWNNSATTSANITKAALNVSANGVNKTYDGTTLAGITLGDTRFGSDDLVVTAASQTFADKNAGAGKTINISGITVTGADAGNYTWSSVTTASANIAKADLYVTASGIGKTYDGTTSANATLNDSRISGDVLSINAGSKTFGDKNSGAGKVITVDGITVTGADAGNYTWNDSTTTSADIAKAALTITATGNNKVYDGTTAAGVTFVDDRFGSDNLVVSSGSKTFSDKNAGTSKLITVGGITVTGTDAGNYTWSGSTTAAADISKAALNVTATGINKSYDGTTSALATLADNRLGADNLVVSSGLKVFADKNAGLGKALTVSGINVTGADAGNYTWNTTAATTADIAKAALSVTAVGVDKTYDGTAGATVTLSDNRIGADLLVLSAASKTFADKNAGTGKIVTVSGINVTGADAGNYTWNSTTGGTADIAKAALAVTATGVNKTYDGNTNALATLSDNRIGPDVLAVSSTGKTFTDKNAGTGKSITVSGINVTGIDAGNYTWNTSALTAADITKAALNITASGINKTYDGTTVAGATLADNRVGSDTLVISSSGQSFADKNAGLGKAITVSGLNVTGADAGNYTWNTTAATSADIAKAALNITASGVNRTYDGTTAAGVNLTDNRIGSDLLVVNSGTSTFADKNAGTGKTITVNGLTVTGVDSGNYAWNTTATTAANISKAALTVTAVGVNKAYDGTTTAVTNLSDNRVGSDSLILNTSGSTFADKNAGVGKSVTVNGIAVTGADANNYTWNATAATTADITKAALSITATGVNKIYDGSATAGATLADNRIGSDDLVISSSGKSFADKNAGLGKAITVSGLNVTGADAGNYTWNTSAATTADITKAALAVTATGINKVYDGTTAAGVNLTDNRIGADALVLSSSSKTFSDKNAGAGKAISVSGINVTGADAGNYTWNTTAAAVADITKAALTITATGANKTYDGTAVAWATLADNRLGSDNLVLSSTGKTFVDKNAGIGKTITVSGIDVTGTDSGNYTWNTSALTSGDIARAALSITASGVDKTYDGTTSAGVTLSDDRIGSDLLVVAAGSKAFADKNAGAAKSISVTGLNVTGADAGNYTWNTSALTSADIAKAALTVTATGVNKTYDGTVGASVNLSDNRLGSDALTLGSTTQTFADKNAGAGKMVNVSGINVTGADAGNYSWNSAAVTTADIAKATLIVSAAGINKTYDANTTAGATLSDNRIGSDALIVDSASKAFADKNAGTGKVIAVSGINVTGADSSNYTWNTTTSTTADIAKAALTVSAAGVDKTYDGTAGASVNLSDDHLGSDSLSITSASNVFANKNAGAAKAITVSGINVTGTDAGNYVWNTTASSTANITKAALTVTATGVNKTYDGTTSAGAVLTDNRIGGDNLLLSSVGNAFSDKNVGAGKAINVSGINVTGADSGNYTWNAATSTSADITKAALSITASGIDKVYDGATTAGTILADNRIASDDLAISAAGSVFTDKNAGIGKAITVNGLNVTGADSGNYTWNTSASTSANIAKASLSITADGVNKTYDGTATANATLNDDRIGSDDLVLSSTTKAFSDKNAGSGKNITVSGINVTGVDAGNYLWNTTALTNADISKAALNVTASGIGKSYDGTTSASVTLTDDRIGSDSLVLSATSKSFSDKNAGLGKTILVNGISVGGADAGNYVWNTSAMTSADIAKAALSVTAIGVDKTYDGTTSAGINLNDDRIGSDALAISASNSDFSDKNAGIGKSINVGGITVVGADAGNYVWNTSASTSANIAKAALNVTATGVNKSYDGTNAAGIHLSDDRIGSDALVLAASSKTFSDKNAGIGKAVTATGINVTGADAGNYTWNTVAASTADISKAALNVTASGVSKIYDGSATANVILNDDRIGADLLVVDASSKLFSDKNAATGKTINVTGINVTGSDSANYTWNTAATTSADITKAALSVSATGVNKTYDGTTDADALLSDNRIGSDLLVVSAGSKAFIDKNAATGKTITIGGITVTGTDAGNYVWNTTATTGADIAKAALSVTASGINKTYDGTTTAGVNLTDNRIGSDVLVLSSASRTFVDKNAGVGKAITVNGITATGADAGNYAWNTSATTTADIVKAALNVTASGINKTYDGSAFAGANLSDDRIGSDVLVINAGSKTFADKNAGLGKAIAVNGISVTGADANNYIWNASAITSADIAKAALTVTANGVNKTYDGSVNATTAFSDDRIGADDLVISSTGSSFADKNAGLNKALTVSGINVTGVDSNNYEWNTTATSTADIAKAALDITASGVNKTYDGTALAGVNLTDNRIGGDLLVLDASSKSFADKNSGLGKTINVNGIMVTGSDAGNYVWNTSATTSADIAKAALNISATGVNRTYDGTADASITFGDNRIGSDLLVVDATSKRFTDKNAGNGKVISVSSINVTGADAGNYTWNAATTATADVSKAALMVTATGLGKVYDGTTAASVNLSDNRIGTDDLVLGSSSTAFGNKNAGVGKSILVSGINVTGADAGNYSWNTSTTAIADIAKAALNISATGVDRTYDSTTAANVILSDNRIGSDLLTVDAASKAFTDKNAGFGKTINVGGITVTGNDAGNYTWNANTHAIANVAKAALNVTASGVNKTFDNTIVANVNLLDNRLGNDTIFITSGSNSFSDTTIGSGKTILVNGIDVTGPDSGNYRWNTSTTAMADISPAATLPEITPPDVTLPVVTPPAVNPPVNHVEETKAISAIASVANTNIPAAALLDQDSAVIMNDFGLLNLGMKLPEDILMEAEHREEVTSTQE